ncbi:hypothetical protein [Sphingomonas phyllosphaerae]|uniref:hypothetical protein n=1 Tax=Sphingomonas phyllosphaerae TaxID=257003 RepID=UPI000425E701|nr:hypothetical protein [Sphingomonas phyllosphaerae]
MATGLVATALATAAPAEAQRYRRYRDRGGDTAAGALIGGVIGLGLGAAIASSNRDRYYDRGYYNRGYYNRGYDRGYYDDRSYYAPPPRVIYRERYYAPPPPRAYYEPRGYYRGYDAPGYYGW